MKKGLLVLIILTLLGCEQDVVTPISKETSAAVKTEGSQDVVTPSSKETSATVKTEGSQDVVTPSSKETSVTGGNRGKKKTKTSVTDWQSIADGHEAAVGNAYTSASKGVSSELAGDAYVKLNNLPRALELYMAAEEYYREAYSFTFSFQKLGRDELIARVGTKIKEIRTRISS